MKVIKHYLLPFMSSSGVLSLFAMATIKILSPSKQDRKGSHSSPIVLVMDEIVQSQKSVTTVPLHSSDVAPTAAGPGFNLLHGDAAV